MSKKKILIIEDEQPLLDLLTAKLDKEGYEIESATDGKAGFDMISKLNPDLILLDIVMPEMDGYEVLENMSKEKMEIPVIIISNSGQPVEIEKTKKLGAVGHLIKTEFNPNDVLAKVKEIFNEEGGATANTSSEEIKPKEDEQAQKLGIKVLLVEDDAFLREICSKKLTKEGYTVFEAVDGEMAVNSVEKVQPDIVLLDIILPAIDGFQVLANIKKSKNKKVAEVPVIMLSNLGQDDDVKKALDLGAVDYLIKAHFTTEEIIEKIKSTLGK